MILVRCRSALSELARRSFLVLLATSEPIKTAQQMHCQLSQLNWILAVCVHSADVWSHVGCIMQLWHQHMQASRLGMCWGLSRLCCRRPGAPPASDDNRWGEPVAISVQHNDATVGASQSISILLDTFHILVLGDSVMWGQVQSLGCASLNMLSI